MYRISIYELSSKLEVEKSEEFEDEIVLPTRVRLRVHENGILTKAGWTAEIQYQDINQLDACASQSINECKASFHSSQLFVWGNVYVGR